MQLHGRDNRKNFLGLAGREASALGFASFIEAVDEQLGAWALLSLLDFFVMASSLKSRRGPMGPLFATDRYCDFDPVDRVVYT